MLGLNLRQEFQGKRLKGTQIELTNDKNTGATQVSAAEFLEITYPSSDLLKAIAAIGPNQDRPVVLLGERGQGKSHLMAALYHALTDTAATGAWLQNWANQLANPQIANLRLRSGMHVIRESLHRQQYKFLWDLLFDCHPHGQYIRGKWEGLGDKKTEVPPYNLILELLQKQPTALILDEFQTWYDGLTNTKQYPWKNWAFNFIQLLSEIAKEYPDLLVLVVSVRNGSTDAYQQIHRVNPVAVDFKGPNAAQDRRRLLLHRLFENRLQVSPNDIESLIATHISEYFRLVSLPPAEHERKKHDFVEAWPFAPHLMQLLEDQVLVATNAQETRDLIKILADLFKGHGEKTPIITAADFRLDDQSSGIASLLDSVSNQHHATLREKAQRNLTAVLDAVKTPATIPHLSETVGALWLRSLAVGNLAGADPATLHIDITKSSVVDDNAFSVELSTIVDNSFNIHPVGDRLVFREEENPEGKLKAFARNDRLFTDGADRAKLAREIRYVLGGSEDMARRFRVIVLPQEWLSDPWSGLEQTEHSDHWDERLPIVVLPEEIDKLDERLGVWLKQHVQKHRNKIRFLLPRSGSTNIYSDRDLLILARIVLKAEEWQKQSPEYGKLQKKYRSELHGMIKQRFDRFAILANWNYAEPKRCRFSVESIKAAGDKIPEAIEERIRQDVFIPEEFEALVLAAAANNDSVGKLLRELQEPRPGEQDCIPWLGETHAKEKVIRICARGNIAIDVRGMEYLQTKPGEEEETAWHRMRSRLGSGKHLDETYLLLPQGLPHSDGVDRAPSTTPSAPQPAGENPFSGTQSIGSTYPDGTQSNPAANASTSTNSIFGGNKTSTVNSLSAPATSALNLIGKVEGWGIGPGTQVRQLSIKIGSLTGAQLQKLLRNLPDGLTYELDLQKED